jgi:hypothetical protein
VNSVHRGEQEDALENIHSRRIHQITFALTTIDICTFSSLAAPADSAAAQSVAVRDGSQDFDFIYGKWRMPTA